MEEWLVDIREEMGQLEAENGGEIFGWDIKINSQLIKYEYFKQ